MFWLSNKTFLIFGASLGDILGEAFDKNSETQDDDINEENKE